MHDGKGDDENGVMMIVMSSSTVDNETIDWDEAGYDDNDDDDAFDD